MNLFKILEDKGISAYRLSKETGIPESTFSRLKSGGLKAENLTLENAFKIADYLKLSVEEIFKG